MIAILDYGAGNLFSVKNALSYLGESYIITNDIREIERADSYILPGVGAFPFAMHMLQETKIIDVLKKQVQSKPLLGICLGMQMLFEESTEFEVTKGLGFIPGKVDYMQVAPLKIPHMGWNALRFYQPNHPLLQHITEGDCVYFVHSYQANTSSEYLVASCEYGNEVPALVSRGNVFGAQFHPEKSGETGLQILRNFGGLTK